VLFTGNFLFSQREEVMYAVRIESSWRPALATQFEPDITMRYYVVTRFSNHETRFRRKYEDAPDERMLRYEAFFSFPGGLSCEVSIEGYPREEVPRMAAGTRRAGSGQSEPGRDEPSRGEMGRIGRRTAPS